MRIYLISVWVFVFFASLSGRASDWFVATNGSDTADGLSPATAFRTINRALDSVSPGETCYVGGGRYHESIVRNDLDGSEGQPIVIRNYGDEDVYLSGTIPIDGPWTQYSADPNIYKTTLSTNIWQLFLDGKSLTLARWPNVEKDWMEPDDSNGYDPTPGSFWDQDSAQCSWAHLMSSSAWGDFQNADYVHDLSSLNKSLEGAVLVAFRCFVTGNDVVSEVITNHPVGSAQFQHTTSHYAKDADASIPYSDARYYIEGDLDCLDAPREWFYDKQTGELFVCFEQGDGPSGHFLEGRTSDCVLDLDNCDFLEFNGINLFSGTFDLYESYDISFKNCKFLYSSYSKHALGNIDPGGYKGDALAPYNMTLGARNPANLTWYNCEFFGYEGIGLYIRTNGSNLVDNCWFHNAQFGATRYGAVSDKKGSGTTIRHCTFETLGMQNATKNGPNGLIEHNMAYNFMFDGDFSVMQVPSGCQSSTTVRYNWAINGSGRNGVRFDGDPAGTQCQVHHVVCMNNNRGFRLKGDQHEIYNLTALGNSPKSDINIAFEKFYGYVDPAHAEESPPDPADVTTDHTLGWPKALGRRGDIPYHGNLNTVVRNIAGNQIDNWPLVATNVAGIWHGTVADKYLRDQLRDPDNYDFRPRAGSDLVDAGSNLVGITENYIGNSSDIGAYEFACSNYWIPGRVREGASFPIPPDSSETAKTNADLIWRAGRDALSQKVYFGSAPDDLTLQTNQLNNIYDPGALDTNSTYYWRVDTQKSSTTVTGQVWSFNASSKEVDLATNSPPYFYSYSFGTSDASSGWPYADSLEPYAIDPDDDSLTFSISAGPSWLNLDADGTLSGVPGSNDLGTATWTVRVEDESGASDQGSLSFSVNPASVASYLPTDDAAVENDQPNTNFGNSDEIPLRTYETGDIRQGYMRFDLSELSKPVKRVVLRLYGGKVNAGVKLYSMTNTVWQEDSITWNNAPAIPTNQIPFAVEPDSVTDWTELTATNLVEHLTPNGQLSLGLVRGYKISNRSLMSKESSTPPKLFIEFQELDPGSYEEWAYENDLPLWKQDYASDPDMDGRNNLFEYGLGGLPSTNQAGTNSDFNPHVMRITRQGTNLVRYIYRKRKKAALHGLSYKVLVSSNLFSENWSTNQSSPKGTSPVDLDYEEVYHQWGSDELPPKFYLRLKIEKE